MSFDIKYRPASFDEVIGNSKAVRLLKSKISRSELPQVILFTGPRGCGKTTLARICAREIGCLPEDKNIDYIEVNSANNRGIDTARSIIEQSGFNPLFNEVRVFILDEVHQTSKDFQNAMLKILEEPPENVYFFLCTTDPQKVIQPLKSRCTVFKVGPLKEDDMEALIESVASQEEIELLEKATESIKELAGGIPREALKLLERVKDVPAKKQHEYVDEEKEKDVLALCRAMLDKAKWKKIAAILDKMDITNAEQVRQGIISYMMKVALSNPGKDIGYRAAIIYSCFEEPKFYNGKPGIVFAAMAASS
jgi:DNA polymerase III gamma/tau subunit